MIQVPHQHAAALVELLRLLDEDDTPGVDAVASWILASGDDPTSGDARAFSEDVADRLVESAQAGFDRLNPDIPEHGGPGFDEWPVEIELAASWLLSAIAGEPGPFVDHEPSEASRAALRVCQALERGEALLSDIEPDPDRNALMRAVVKGRLREALELLDGGAA